MTITEKLIQLHQEAAAILQERLEALNNKQADKLPEIYERYVNKMSEIVALTNKDEA